VSLAPQVTVKVSGRSGATPVLVARAGAESDTCGGVASRVTVNARVVGLVAPAGGHRCRAAARCQPGASSYCPLPRGGTITCLMAS
jgi:hypothetical protein